jgi:hypothetical protein
MRRAAQERGKKTRGLSADETGLKRDFKKEDEKCFGINTRSEFPDLRILGLIREICENPVLSADRTSSSDAVLHPFQANNAAHPFACEGGRNAVTSRRGPCG